MLLVGFKYEIRIILLLNLTILINFYLKDLMVVMEGDNQKQGVNQTTNYTLIVSAIFY